RHDVIDGEAPAPVLLGQTIDADLPAEAATVENDRAVGKRREIDLAGDDVGLELERAAPGFIEPDVDAGEIAGRHRTPSQRGAGRGLLLSPFQVEEIHRREARKAVVRKLSFPRARAAGLATRRS